MLRLVLKIHPFGYPIVVVANTKTLLLWPLLSSNLKQEYPVLSFVTVMQCRRLIETLRSQKYFSKFLEDVRPNFFCTELEVTWH